MTPTEYTPEQIEDARRNPRAGDVWRVLVGGSYSEVTVVNPDDETNISASVVKYTVSNYPRKHPMRALHSSFDRWTAGATLVKRGPE